MNTAIADYPIALHYYIRANRRTTQHNMYYKYNYPVPMQAMYNNALYRVKGVTKGVVFGHSKSHKT